MLAIWTNMAAFLSDEVVRTAGWTAKPSGLAFLVIKGHVFFANPSSICMNARNFNDSDELLHLESI